MTEAVRLATGLHFPEGPAVLPDGRVAFVECYAGRVVVWSPDDGQVRVLARVGGAPDAVIVGPEGSLLVTQNGGMVGPWRAPDRPRPSIQIILPDGRVDTFVDIVDGIRPVAPNDLVFGPDGFLYFTDAGEAYDPEARHGSGRIFRVGPDGVGVQLIETGPTYPNGIAVDIDGGIVWSESYTRAIRRWRGGAVELLATLPERSVPDGLAIAQDGRIFVTGTRAGGLEVLDPDGRASGFVRCGAIPTNCCFDGTALYVTDGGQPGLAVDVATDVGSLWRLEVGVAGLPLPEPFARAA